MGKRTPDELPPGLAGFSSLALGEKKAQAPHPCTPCVPAGQGSPGRLPARPPTRPPAMRRARTALTCCFWLLAPLSSF